MVTNKQLREIFNRLNKRYFKNKIRDSVRFADLSEYDAIGVSWNDGSIEVDNKMRKIGVCSVERILLHEMVHAELRDHRIADHGYVFQRRINKLFAQGAYKGIL